MPSKRAGHHHLADEAGSTMSARDNTKAGVELPKRANPTAPSKAGQGVSAGKAGMCVPAHERGGTDQVSQAAEAAVSLSVSSSLDQLAELQVRRKFYIATTNRQTNAAKALIRRYLGWRFDTDETEREKINGDAARIVADALAGKMAAGAIPDLMVVRAAIEPLRAARHSIEKEMKGLVRTLPVYAWASEVRGLGDLGLAVILGEAGDLARYPKKGHLWKRLGLAPHAGKAYSTWRRDGGLASEDWIAAGYSPRRRAEIFAVVSEPLFRRQSMTDGPYRAIYDRRRSATARAHPDWSKGHSHADALRVMTKYLLHDLWKAYRRANGIAPERADEPAPAGRQAIGLLSPSTSKVMPAGLHIAETP